MNVLVNRQRSVQITMKISEIILLVELQILGAFYVTLNSSKMLPDCNPIEYEMFSLKINETVALKFKQTHGAAFQNSVVSFFWNRIPSGFLFFKCTPGFTPSTCVDYKMANDTIEGLKTLVSRQKKYKGIISINEKDKMFIMCNNGSLLPFAKVQLTEVHLREGMFCSAIYGGFLDISLKDCSSKYIQERYRILETRLRAFTFNGVRSKNIKPFPVHESRNSMKRLLLLPVVLAVLVGLAIIAKKTH